MFARCSVVIGQWPHSKHVTFRIHLCTQYIRHSVLSYPIIYSCNYIVRLACCSILVSWWSPSRRIQRLAFDACILMLLQTWFKLACGVHLSTGAWPFVDNVCLLLPGKGILSEDRTAGIPTLTPWHAFGGYLTFSRAEHGFSHIWLPPDDMCAFHDKQPYLDIPTLSIRRETDAFSSHHAWHHRNYSV